MISRERQLMNGSAPSSSGSAMSRRTCALRSAKNGSRTPDAALPSTIVMMSRGSHATRRPARMVRVGVERQSELRRKRIQRAIFVPPRRR